MFWFRISLLAYNVDYDVGYEYMINDYYRG